MTDSFFKNKFLRPLSDWLSNCWLVILFLIISFSFLANWYSNQQIQTMESYARMADISTAQRMGILEIGILTNVLCQTKDTAEQEDIRERILYLMVMTKRYKHGLIHGDEVMQLSGDLPESIQWMFFHPPYSLDRRLSDYLANVKALLEEPPENLNFDNPLLKSINSIMLSHNLVNDLTELAKAYEKEGKSRIFELHQQGLWLLSGNFLMLLLISLFIVFPMFRRVRRNISELNKMNQTLDERAKELEVSRRNALEMMNDAREAHKHAEENEERLSTIIDSALDAVVGMDVHGMIIYWNPQAEKIFGWSSKEVVGKRSMSETIIPLHYRAGHEKGLTNYLSTNQTHIMDQRLELTALHRDGHEFPIELTVSALRLKGQKIFSAFLRDISERKSAEEKIIKSAEQLKKSNKELEQFAFIASHDLQEPLRIVSSYTQLWAHKYNEQADPTSQKYISYVLTNIERMQCMISGLLSYSRIDKDVSPLEQVDTEEILNHTITNLTLAAKEKKAVVTYDPLPHVWAHKIPLLQVFQNLISNAIKYSKQEPRIHVSVQTNNDEWIFTVTDNGIGIASEYYERIFQLFQRLHTKSEYQGTGLGLSICKKIVEKFGGRIWVESKLNEGSKFRFTLPKRKG